MGRPVAGIVVGSVDSSGSQRIPNDKGPKGSAAAMAARVCRLQLLALPGPSFRSAPGSAAQASAPLGSIQCGDSVFPSTPLRHERDYLEPGKVHNSLPFLRT